jgi:hypothetical protein
VAAVHGLSRLGPQDRSLRLLRHIGLMTMTRLWRCERLERPKTAGECDNSTSEFVERAHGSDQNREDLLQTARADRSEKRRKKPKLQKPQLDSLDCRYLETEEMDGDYLELQEEDLMVL